MFGNVTLTPKAKGVQTTLEQDGMRERVWLLPKAITTTTCMFTPWQDAMATDLKPAQRIFVMQWITGQKLNSTPRDYQ